MLAVAILSASAGVAAQDTSRARSLFAEGERLFADGDFDSALTVYSSAYRLAPLPGFLFNIGQCHRKLGHFLEARRYFERYLEAAPDAPNRSDVEQLLREVSAASAISPPEARETTRLPEMAERPAHRADAVSSPPTSRPIVDLPAWLALGAFAVFGGFAVWFAFDLDDAQSRFDDPELVCSRMPDRCLELRDRGRSAALFQNVSAIAAGAAFLTAGALIAINLGRRDGVRLAVRGGAINSEFPW